MQPMETLDIAGLDARLAALESVVVLLYAHEFPTQARQLVKRLRKAAVAGPQSEDRLRMASIDLADALAELLDFDPT
jgi:hypothetical protein